MYVMDNESVTILSISQLIHQSHPLTSASSLSSSNHKPTPNLSDENHNLNFSTSTHTKTLKTLNAPSVIIGTLNLPFHNYPSSPSISPSGCSKVACFSFSDDHFSICCDILDFHPRLLGKKIRVLAWNYIPFNSADGGFLEIINWAFADSSGFLVPCSSKLESFPLRLDFSGNVKEICNARYYVHGVIESVSPVTVVPCNVGGKDDKGASLVSGFLTKVLVCDCKLCSSRDPGKALCSFYQHGIDNLTKSFFVYFYDFASSWHPVVSRLVGNYVSLTGLKKKLIFIGKQDSQLMYVTSVKSTLHLPRLQDQCVLFQKTNILGKGETGEYMGVVTEIYMQGMVVELDKKVMLLLTDQLLNITHSLRVGAIVSNILSCLFSFYR